MTEDMPSDRAGESRPVQLEDTPEAAEDQRPALSDERDLAPAGDRLKESIQGSNEPHTERQPNRITPGQAPGEIDAAGRVSRLYETDGMAEALEHDSTESEKITFSFKRSHFYGALVPLAFVLGLSVGFLFWGRNEPAAQPAAAAQAPPQGQASSAGAAPSGETQPSQGEAPQRYDIPVDDDPFLGPEDAPITIVEFSDYECPYCQRFHVETFGRLLEAYPDQIRFVYRDFPLTQIHPNAISAAEAANCAREQGAFWEYHDLLFGGSEGLSQNSYISYANRLGLDQESFAACLENRTYQDEVQADFDFAAQLGVRSTPTFFINGLPLIGAQPFEVFQQVLDQELAGEIP